ncbi:MAG: ABC-F family ATP-binding cassette domain-containing protein [Alphaproteobacteria bacterium]|nr:ABC-F family ATP-binding cassette domain-containing protein [Alphaproteobacteria bacterium]
MIDLVDAADEIELDLGEVSPGRIETLGARPFGERAKRAAWLCIAEPFQGADDNGKSTLARLLAGRLAPEDGELARPGKLAVGFFAQHQIDELNPSATPFQHLAELMPDRRVDHVRAYLGRFGFPGQRADVPAADLSGGEKARLTLARIAVGEPQLLILNEPTNHLDIDAREALVHALNAYAGAVVLVSHDAHLVELVADRLWLVAEGTAKPFEGDVDDYRKLLLDTSSDGGKRSTGSSNSPASAAPGGARKGPRGPASGRGGARQARPAQARATRPSAASASSRPSATNLTIP